MGNVTDGAGSRGNVLGQTITGTIDVADDRVRTEVALTWLMGHLVKPAEALIKREGELMRVAGLRIENWAV